MQRTNFLRGQEWSNFRLLLRCLVFGRFGGGGGGVRGVCKIHIQLFYVSLYLYLLEELVMLGAISLTALNMFS